MNLNIGKAHLIFRDDAGYDHVVSIASILDGGTPIDEESGNDMELVSEDLVTKDRKPFEFTIVKKPLPY